LISKLKHPHIVSCIKWFQEVDKTYIVMELAEQGDLASAIDEYLDEAHIIDILF
jgi:hypothetical protein